MEGTTVEDDLPIEAMEDDEMPDLVDTDPVSLATLPDRLQDQDGISSTEEKFNIVSFFVNS